MGLFVLEVTDRSFQVSTTLNLHCVRTVAEKTAAVIHARNRVLFMLSSGVGVEFGSGVSRSALAFCRDYTLKGEQCDHERSFC
jgi:hypothetical protein